MKKFFGRITSVKFWHWLLPVLTFGLVFGLCQLDAPLYAQPIVRVAKVVNDRRVRQVDNFGNVDAKTKQQVSGRLLNTTKHGRQVRFTNTFSGSGALDTRLRVGEEVFMQRQKRGYQMQDVKRDGVVLGLLAATLVLMALVVKRRAVLIFGSLLANVLLLLVTLHLETSPANQ